MLELDNLTKTYDGIFNIWYFKETLPCPRRVAGNYFTIVWAKSAVKNKRVTLS